MDDGLIGLGVIGCGGFGLFALQQFTQVPGVRLVGMAGTHRPASLAAAARFGVENVDDVGELLAPRRRGPGLHRHPAVPPPPAGDGRPGGRQARDRREAAGHDRRPGRRADRRRPAAGPAAGRQPHAAVQPALRRRAPAGRGAGCWATCSTGRSRTTPRTRTCRPTTGSGTARKSGGIFVEHGVHFFDLFAGWLGDGRVEAAQVGVRPGTAIEEHVHAHGPLRRGGPGQLLPRLPPGRADGPPGTPAGVRAGRRDPLRLGADPGPDPCGGGRAADPRPVRPVPRGPARRGRLLRRQGPRLPGPGQGDRRLPDHRALVRATARRSRRSTAGCSGR